MSAKEHSNTRPLGKIILASLFLVSSALVGTYVLHGDEILDFIRNTRNIPQIPINAHSVLKKFKHAAVAADHKDCSKIGADLLKQGGHAVDAAIGTLLCAGVRNIYTSGLGGGGYMTIYDKKSGNAEAVDFREAAPSHFKKYTQVKEYCKLDAYTIKHGDGITVGIPGELKGMEYAWKRYGKLPWKKLFEPAIALARKGINIHASLANAITREEKTIKTSKTLSRYLAPGGDVLLFEAPLNLTVLGNTLQRIADSGSADIFYNGEMSQTIVDDINDNGGDFTLEDLKNYEVVSRKPVRVKISGGELISVPPPAGGVILGGILNVMNEFKMDSKYRDKHPVDYYHKLVEAFKYIHAPATFLQDPKFGAEVDELVSTMTNPKEGKRIKDIIDDKSYADPHHYGKVNLAYNPTSGTTHLSVLNSEGNAVAITSSINKYFGSKIYSSELGIIYNNQIQDALYHCRMYTGQMPDLMQAGKRPFSDMCPSIILDPKGDVKMVLGAAGGHYIPTVLAQVMMNYLWFNDSLKEAIDRPRIHNNLLPDVTLVENGIPTTYWKQLEDMGHPIVTNLTEKITGVPIQIVGVVQAVVRTDNGRVEAYADARKGGEADGF